MRWTLVDFKNFKYFWLEFDRDICDASTVRKLQFDGFSVTGDGGGPYSGVEAILPFATRLKPLKYFPPQVGYRWNKDGYSNGYRVESIAEVTSISETVSITKGTFNDCAKVEETLSYPYGYTPGQSYPIKFERWFAPGVGPVKLVIIQNDGGIYSGELTSHQNIPAGLDDYFPLGLNYTWTFTMTGGRSATWVVSSAGEETEHLTVDGSKFFNGLDIQAYLPDFDNCDRPVYGTFPDPTFNGLLPDFTQERFGDSYISLPEYYVNVATGNDNNLGDTPSSALKTITKAVYRANSWGFGIDRENCDIVINVAAGTYNLASGESFPIEIDSIVLQGAGADTTIVDAGGTNKVIRMIIRSTVDGFTITGGNSSWRGGGIDATGPSSISNCIIIGNTASSYGGGIKADDNSTIRDCTISNNTLINSWSGGGGIYCWGGTSVIDCVIKDNSGSSGGGIYASESVIRGCTINNNNATGDSWGGGGGIYANSSEIENCLIVDNNASHGGGLYLSTWYGYSRIVNSVISQNSAARYGGGVYVEIDYIDYLSSPVFPVDIINCTLDANTAANGPAIMINRWSGSAEVRITNSIIWGSGINPVSSSGGVPLTITYSDIQGGWPGEGNIGGNPNDNPLFVDPVNGNYHLQPGSPCIDAGTNTFPSLPVEDFEGDIRPWDGKGDGASKYDMGVDEFIAETKPTTTGGETISFINGEITLTFDTVESSGDTTVTFSSEGTQPPANFQVSSQYFQVSTTATVSGPINLCFTYSDTGLTGGEELALQLMHYNTSLGQWEDTTTSVDIVNNIICGRVTSLSEFLIAFDPDNVSENSITLNNSWNLISLCEEPEDTAIATVLAPISGKYSSVWAFKNGNWQVYDPVNPGFSDLTTMEAGWGYWLNMTEVATLTISGSTPSNSIDLINGWNLVGNNTSTSPTVADALASINGKYVSVWAYINGGWKVYDPAKPGFSDLTTMEPNYGYWIKTTEDCTWILP